MSDVDRRRRALELVAAGRTDEAVAPLRAELASGDEGAHWFTDAIVQAMRADDLRPAGDLAWLYAQLRWGATASPADGATRAAGPLLSLGKLRHDVEQLCHLRSTGLAAPEVDGMIDRYLSVARRLATSGSPAARVPLTPADEDAIGDGYGRLVHVRSTPRLDRALSDRWDPVAVEDAYLDRAPGVVVIDDFLTPEALDGLQRFCLESTVWSGNRYPHDRLGAFFVSGFNCPLLLQVAEELRAAFPRVIGAQHGLRQLWGFKYPPYLPGDSTIHADFAAVNVNFWITPDRANLDPSSGGLLVYAIDAPPTWDFADYNERLDTIKEYLRQSRPRVIDIPYRENRAVVFDSDLFHATAEVRFRPEYEHRRVNVTMLYGERAEDRHHHAAPGASGAGVTRAWRSPALTRSRRG
jgi:hypothetical protein